MVAQGCGHGTPVLGARRHLVGGEGFLGNSFLAAQAPDVEGLVLGPHALEPGHLLGEEVAEAPPELHRPRRTEVEEREGRRRRAPCGDDELDDASEPLLIEVVDGSVV